MSHETLVFFAKTFGLIWLMVVFVVVAVLAYRPSKRAEYERAARSILPEHQAGSRTATEASSRTGNRE